MAACRSMLMKGVIPMPPAMSTPARSGCLCRVREPKGPLIWSLLSMGRAPSARLKVLSRMRVATSNSSSWGALTMEKVWRTSGDLGLS
ncbi:hypothetical protein D3C76_1297970 [compost metagenome]